TVLDAAAPLQVTRREAVALLAVRVVQQRAARGAAAGVLDVRDLRPHAVLVASPAVDPAVGALVATTPAAHAPPTGMVTPDPAVRRADQRRLGRGPRDLDEVGDAGATTARSRRLVLADTHCLSVLGSDSGIWTIPTAYAVGPPKMSIRSPSARVTNARLVAARWPTPVRVRLRLPTRLIVLTPVTLTEKTDCTASLIWVLLARGSTRNVYLFSSMSA